MKKEDIKALIAKGVLYFDGGTGTALQKEGLAAGEYPEEWNISHPEKIQALHAKYIRSGANIIKANTFGANSEKFSKEHLSEIINAAFYNARMAISETGKEDVLVALDIGPLGRMIKPWGDLDFEDAVSIFAETVKAGSELADLILIETVGDTYEMKAAMLAAKENSSLPIFVTMSFGTNGKLMTGTDPAAAAIIAESLGATAIGVNCSAGPMTLVPIVKEMYEHVSLPIIANPNAGLPRASEDGKPVYDLSPEKFALEMLEILSAGARILGGCCGTTPEYIKALRDATKGSAPLPTLDRQITSVASYTHAVIFGSRPVIIGERINPTGKKKLKEALRSGDINYVLSLGIEQKSLGAEILDVNTGLPEIDEPKMLKKVISELQRVTDLPLQADTSDPVAMEAALRIYNGKPLVNSVNAKEESLASILPLVAKYGGTLVALTLDENGIPQSAEGRLAIAKKIVDAAAEYGISKKDIIFDPLALSVGSDPQAPQITLDALKLIKSELGALTSLGVSNVSFGLPERELVNSTFFAMALAHGLDAAIMNPSSFEMMKTYRAFNALLSKDIGFSEYLKFASDTALRQPTVATSDASNPSAASYDREEKYSSDSLEYAIIHGIAPKAEEYAKDLSSDRGLNDIITARIIPALDSVISDYDKGKAFLPQLLMSVEAANIAISRLREKAPAVESKGELIMATVKGDIHDIGKNIVRSVLESYGYRVYDLGRDVPPEEILRVTSEKNISFVALSALMTTTVPAMKSTIDLLRKNLPNIKIAVGGAVLNEECARLIGADRYCPDATAALRFAEEIFS